VRDVAFSCDDNGAPFLRVAVWSLLNAYRGEEPIRVNVFEGYGGHSAANKSALADVVARFPKATLRYVDVEPVLAPYAELLKPRTNSRWNVFTWTPVFTPVLLPDATGNVIHFDIDMLFNADISPLFELPFSQPQPSTSTSPCLIACVHEYHKCAGKVESAIWEKGILPPTVERYFNTGVLVFNVAACRAERTWEKILDWYRDHYEIADRIEQDAWNALYWDRTLALPVCWNFHDRNMKGYAKWDVEAKYWLGNAPRACLQASLAPAILHFWGPKKPWKTSHRPYRKLYHAAMRAVGLKPPKEPLLAPYYDLVNGFNRWRIARRLSADERTWRWRERLQTVRAVLLAPFEWLGIGLGLAFFGFLPRRALLAACDFVSLVYWACDVRGRRIAARNLTVMFAAGAVLRVPSPAALRLIVRRSYRNMCRTVGHAFWTCFRAKDRVVSAGALSPAAKAFLAANRPAVTVSGHIGCWEILSQLAFLEGHSMMSVAKDIGTGGMTRLLMRARKSIGQEIVRADGAFKPLMAGLKDGKSLGLLVDQNVSPRKGGVWVRFFGRPVPVSAAPAFFAAKAKASIVVAWSRPLKDGRYRCDVTRTYPWEAARDVWGLTQSIATDLERIVRRHPSCWVLNYDFFARTPQPHELETLEKRAGKGAART